MFKSGPFLVLGLVAFQVFGAPMPDASTSTTKSSTVTIVSSRSSDATTMITSTASPSTIDPDVASSTFVEKEEVRRTREATAKEEVTTQEPSSSIHPRFKFMEAQMEHKHKDLEEEFKDFSDTTPTVPPTTTQAIPTSCPGCPFEAEVKTDIVDFAVQELLGGEAGLCKKSLVRVENFLSQVVAGMLYKFDLVLEHHPENPASCQVPLSNPETCRMVVYDIPWQEKKTVQWDQVDCSGNPSMLTKSTTSTSPIVSSFPSPSTTREPPVESSSGVSESGDAVTSTPDIVTSTSAFSIHPRFKYMEAGMKKELEQENTVENDVQSTATLAVTTTIPVDVKNIEDTLVPINFPTLNAGGLLPGGPGTVRKIKKVSREEKKRMLEEIDLKFSPVVEDIKEEFGILLKNEREKSTEEIKGLKQTIDDLEEELEKAKEKYRPGWLPGWGWF